MIGKNISHYKIDGKLGAGGMGVVYRAEDTKIRRTVALKFLPDNLVRDAETKARFIREARTAGQLDHPNICTIYEIGETDDGQLFIAMAYYDGATLTEKIAEGRLPIDEALNLAGQIPAGLDKAHAAGIVHRDIKPANILLTSDGLVKIVDFGLAKLTDQTNITKTGTTLGSGSYMAPEQASGQEADSKADIWALAVVCYEMLTGQRPFQGDHLPAVVYAIVNGEPEAPSAVNPALDTAIDDALLRGMAKDPADRFPSASDLVEALGAEPGAAPHRPGPRPRIDRQPGRKPGWPGLSRRVAIALVALAILVAGAFGLSRLGQEKLAGPLPPISPNNRSLVVLPFSFRGNEPDRQFAQQFNHLLIDRLIAVGDLHVVAGDTLVPFLTAKEHAGDSFSTLAETASRLEADLVLAGQVTVSQGHLQVRLTFANQERVFDTFSGPTVSLETILAHANLMALKSVPNLFPENRHQLSRMAALTSDNWELVSHFIEAENYRNFMYTNGWNIELDNCTRIDSTFALTYFSKMLYEGWFENFRGIQAATEKARRFSQPLPQTGRDLIEAAALNFEDEIDEAENLVNRILLNDKDLVDGWNLLATMYYAHNQFRGRNLAESRGAFEEMKRLDPRNRLPGIFLRFLYSMDGDKEALEEFFTPEDGSPMPRVARVILAFMGDDHSLQEALADSLDISRLNGMQAYILNFPDNHFNSLRFLNFARPKVEGQNALGWVEETLAHLEAGVGRWDKAKEHFSQMPPGLQPWRLTYQAIMTSMPFMHCSEREIRALLSEIDNWKPRTNFTLDPDNYGLVANRYSPDFALHPVLKEFSLGLLYTRLGDLEAARASLARLETLPVPSGNAPMIKELVLSVRGWIAYEEEDYSGVLTILEDAAQYALPSMSYSGLHDRPFQRYLRALALTKVGRHGEAAPWFEFIDQKTERTLGFKAPAHLELGGICEKTGNLTKALRHYQAFLELYRDCDERYQPLVEKARARMATIQG